MTKKAYLFSIFFTVLTIHSFSQNREFKISEITDQYGQSPGATFSIIEDNLGFIWFGTLNGLMRYDGYGYKRFIYTEDDKISLSGNLIRAMHMDDQGVIWIATQGGGLNRFDTRTESFISHQHDENNEFSISSNDAWAIAGDKSGNIWIGTWSEGLNRFDKQTGLFTRYRFGTQDNKNQEDAIRSLLVDNDGFVWVGFNSNGIVKLNPDTGEYIRYKNTEGDNGTPGSNAIYRIYQDDEGHIWFCTIGGGLNLYNPVENSFQAYYPDAQSRENITGNNIYSIIRISTGEYLVGYEGAGLDLFHKESGNFRSMGERTESSLTSNRIRFLYEDSKGIIWVGSETGVDKITRYKNFRAFRHRPGDPNSLNARTVRSIYQDHRGLIWIGSFNVPLTCYDPRRNQFNHNEKIQQTIGYYGVTSMLEDDEMNFWIGTTRGIYVFDKYQNLLHRFTSNPSQPGSLSDNAIQKIAQGVNGEIWAGTENGLNVFNPSTNTWRAFKYQPGVPGALGNAQIQPNALVVEEDGTVWAGTWGGGLNKYNPGEDTFTYYTHQPNNPNSLSNNNVLAIHPSEDGILWLGTFGGGLVKFDPAGETFTTYTENDGLANNIIFSILDDNQGNLWIATDNGLSKFNPHTEVFLNFDVSDGLPSNQFFWGASFKSVTGVIVFGTVDGLLSFLPDNIQLNRQIPDIQLTDFKKYNESVSTGISITYSDKIDVKHGEMNFQIEFAALDYTDPQKNQFAYKIAGGNEQWIHIGNRNFISFTNMAPGRYKLLIKASNNDGFWNEEGISLTMIIHPPYWQTSWFRAGMLILALLALFLFIRLRTAKISKQKRILEGIVKERTKELALRNEELNTTNDELRYQGEELSSTLETLKKTQKQLIHSEKMASLGVLAAGVAHEINNPLNFIKGAVMAIEEHLNETPEKNDQGMETLMKIANEGISRASAIVTSLNHYSRKDDEKHEPADVHVIVNNCLVILKEQIGSKIIVKKEYDTQNNFLICNEGKLHQALLNVLSNAIHSIENKGEILVFTRVDENNMVIGVKDTGSGMTPETLSRITDPFFTTKSPGEGTGLGLSITQNIINEHGGKLEFYSEPGRGTTVLMNFPRTE